MSSTNEEYFLSWKDHGKNFSLAFSDLLQDDKLVDVQLVAEGHLISAHRLILSAMSPYFCNMFSQIPANQQAFVFLQDISKQTVTDLITFIYRGEVNVKHECLDKFMKAAKALNIQGLIDFDCLESFDSQPFTSTVAKPTFSDTVYHPFAPIGIQYQSVQSSTPFQRPVNKNRELDGFNFDENIQMNDSNLQKNYNKTAIIPWKNEVEIGANIQATAPKRKKMNNDISKYNIVADIRNNQKDSGQHLYYADEKFQKHGKSMANEKQRWQCTKAHSQKCRAAVSTINVNGVTMMSILSDEHTHDN